MAKIQDREATIKTALVEIKVLTVSGRQVTQSLFRQLLHESLIDEETLQLAGVPWGRVNYHVDCVQLARWQHLHIVWQHGDQLRRDCIYMRGGESLTETMEKDQWRCAAAGLVLASQEEEPEVCTPSDGTMLRVPISEYRSDGAAQVCLALGRVSVEGFPTTCSSELSAYWKLKRAAAAEAQWSHAMAVIRLKNHCHPHLHYDWEKAGASFYLDEDERLKSEIKRIRSRWTELYQTLGDLDQLFIAV